MPVGYRWLVQQGLVGYVPDSALQPWYSLPKADAFSAVDRWPGVNPQETLGSLLGRQIEAGSIRILASGGKRFPVVAASFSLSENDWDIFESPFEFRSQFRGNQ
jgi:hypothetical protein